MATASDDGGAYVFHASVFDDYDKVHFAGCNMSTECCMLRASEISDRGMALYVIAPGSHDRAREDPAGAQGHQGRPRRSRLRVSPDAALAVHVGR